MSSVSPLTRRRLIQAGAAGAATVWLGSLTKYIPAAGASQLTAELRRSSYLALTDPGFKISIDGGTVPLQMVGVDDLSIAATVPALRNSDEAFAVRFRGTGSAPFAGGTRTMSHPELGTFRLFVSPIDERTATQDYEAVIDRTIKIPGINEDGSPDPVDPGPRGGGGVAANGKPAAKAPAATAARFVRASLKRSSSGRKVLADVTLGGADVREVRALLLRRGKVVGKATVKGGRKLKLRFALRSRTRSGVKYELALTVVDRAGKVTSLRRNLRVG